MWPGARLTLLDCDGDLSGHGRFLTRTPCIRLHAVFPAISFRSATLVLPSTSLMSMNPCRDYYRQLFAATIGRPREGNRDTLVAPHRVSCRCRCGRPRRAAPSSNPLPKAEVNVGLAAAVFVPDRPVQNLTAMPPRLLCRQPAYRGRFEPQPCSTQHCRLTFARMAFDRRISNWMLASPFPVSSSLSSAHAPNLTWFVQVSLFYSILPQHCHHVYTGIMVTEAEG